MARHSHADGMEIAWREAWRVFGGKYWRWFVYGRLMIPLTVAVVTVAGLWWTWTHVSHVMLAMGCAAAAGVLLLYVLWSRLSLQARMRHRPSAAVTGLLLVAVAVLTGAAAAALQW